MINDYTILAIIPARGGSKGVPGKNIKPLAGKPLLAWTIEAAQQSQVLDRVILSSDDANIIETAKEYGCEVPFIRPADLARDDTPGIDPILHAIQTLPEKYDYVCMLQPTSPLRTAEHIDGCIRQCIGLKAPACVSVTKVQKHPNWMYYISEDGKMIPYEKQDLVLRRQDLPDLYVLNGAVYVARTDFLLKEKSFLTPDTVAFTMDKYASIDIDDELDLEMASFLKSLKF